MQFLGFSADDVDEKAVGMYYDYGTTLAGLVVRCGNLSAAAHVVLSDVVYLRLVSMMYFHGASATGYVVVASACSHTLAHPPNIPHSLQAQGHKIDYKHWHDFVHGRLDHGRMLQPDAQLRECLFALEMPKYVFTNSDIDHTRKCLQCLGIEDAFRVRTHVAG